MRYYASRSNAPFGETACVAHVYHILYYKVKSKKKKCHKAHNHTAGGQPRLWAAPRRTTHATRLDTLPHDNLPPREYKYSPTPLFSAPFPGKNAHIHGGDGGVGDVVWKYVETNAAGQFWIGDLGFGILDFFGGVYDFIR